MTTLFVFRVNVGCGPAEERLLLTGLHAVADIYCENCHTTLGWKYVSESTCKLNAGFFSVIPVLCFAKWVNVVSVMHTYAVGFDFIVLVLLIARVLICLSSLTVFTFFDPLCDKE